MTHESVQLQKTSFTLAGSQFSRRLAESEFLYISPNLLFPEMPDQFG